MLRDATAAASPRERFDVFVSHSIKDAEIVLGAKSILERSGLSVYVDWIVDPHLDRTRVSGTTAKRLRERMRQCCSLMYLHSRYSTVSRWMPWELGFFDGVNGNVAVLPVVPDAGSLSFAEQEYLEIYPKVDFINLDKAKHSPFINKTKQLGLGSWKSLSEWIMSNDKLTSA